MGHAAPFEFAADYRPGAGISRQLCGTPGVLAMAALETAIDLIDAADTTQIREKSKALTSLFIDLVAQECGAWNFSCVSPVDPTQRGSQACSQ